MSERVAIVGGGIVGLAHAWRESVHGASVTLFEQDRVAEGASVRNFGMVWPIGQPPRLLDAALLSRSLWGEAVRGAGLWANPVGSLHVAIREDELAVLSEFAERAPDLGYQCRLLSADETRAACPAADVQGLRGGLFSETELGVDPREALAKIPAWLAERHNVEFHYRAKVTRVEPPRLWTHDGSCYEFDRVTIATGADFQTLFPEVHARARLSRCKLQMMRTARQPRDWRLGPMVASGLTLRHYPTFEVCESLAALRERVAGETPELDRYGIHVMAAQNGAGEVVLGDSHEYGEAITPFNKEEISRLMLRELRKVIALPDWTLSEQWSGIYAIRPASREAQFVNEPIEGVTAVIATGGCGMTMSFGLAERMVERRASGQAIAPQTRLFHAPGA